MLEMFESYSFCKLHLVEILEQILFSITLMMQIELKPDADVSDLFHYT